MDRRQQKTRAAIFQAFINLLSKKRYQTITVQNIIDEANISRSTFYTHFETRDELLKALCQELFQHILCSSDHREEFNHFHCEEAGHSIFHHILWHMKENDNKFLTLLSSQNNELFLEYFKSGMASLVAYQIDHNPTPLQLPRDFAISHISGSFVSLVMWWIEGDCKEDLETLENYFRLVMSPVITF